MFDKPIGDASTETAASQATSVFDIVKPANDGSILLAGSSQDANDLVLLRDGEPVEDLQLNRLGQWTTNLDMQVPQNSQQDQQITFAIAERDPQTQELKRPYLAETAILLICQDKAILGPFSH